MTFLELVKLRQSDRVYDSTKTVEQEKLDYILEAARLAPSACNAQPWRFVVVTNPAILKETANAVADKTLGMNQFVFQAPVLIVILEASANLTSTFGSTVKQKHFPHMDLGIAAAHISLAAAEQGLGSCIIGWFNEKKLKEVLHIPMGKRPIMVLTLGYSKQETRDKRRKPMEEVVHFNRFR